VTEIICSKQNLNCMARLNHNGFAFTGKLGQVVGCTWKGKPYLRTIPQKSSRPPSQAQLEQRLKFKTVGDFLKPFIPLVGKGFEKYAPSMTGYNGALQFNYHHALKESGQGYYIEYRFAALTWGFLQNVSRPHIAAEPGGMIRFNWENEGSVLLKDEMVLIIYEPQQQQCLYTIGKAKRGDLTALFDALIFAGRVVHAWISCHSPSTGKMAQSSYLGALMVP